MHGDVHRLRSARLPGALKAPESPGTVRENQNLTWRMGFTTQPGFVMSLGPSSASASDEIEQRLAAAAQAVREGSRIRWTRSPSGWGLWTRSGNGCLRSGRRAGLGGDGDAQEERALHQGDGRPGGE